MNPDGAGHLLLGQLALTTQGNKSLGNDLRAAGQETGVVTGAVDAMCHGASWGTWLVGFSPLRE